MNVHRGKPAGGIIAYRTILTCVICSLFILIFLNSDQFQLNYLILTSTTTATTFGQVQFDEWANNSGALANWTTGQRDNWTSPQPLIVFWTTFFSLNLAPQAQNQIDLHCPRKCNYSSDKQDVERAAAVIFHPRDLSLNDLPKPENRRSFQRYVFFLQETPMHSGGAYQTLRNGYFNLTMTYRLDSDVFCGYWNVVPRNRTDNYPSAEPVPFDYEDIVKAVDGKSVLATQFVSNCATPSKRERYVRELQKHVRVDVYGACGTKKCSRSENRCGKLIGEKYFFYLAFENSVCKDYTTEKFIRPLLEGAVPVVLRKEDLSAAPDHSYIAVDQFKSAKHLADYLTLVASNKTMYLAYFEWRKRYWKEFIGKGTAPYCDLCLLLHNNSYPNKSYDIQDYWLRQGDCQPNFASRFL